MKNNTFVSIIIPCFKEGRYIKNCLDSIIANNYPKENLEILVVDGMSDDETRAIIKIYQKNYYYINLLDNHKKITPAALNIGLKKARGNIIMRMDAHVTYASNYISGLVIALGETGADNVGGKWVTQPGNDTQIAQAIALALSHPFGVGNAYFRIGVSRPCQVDTVPFGCYRREVFNRLGNFDERLERNQDIEFNSRLRKAGGRIFLIPNIISSYYARATLKSLAIQNFQNGQWNIYSTVVNHKSHSYRHFIPFAFVGFLLLTAIFSNFYRVSSFLFWLLLGSYFLGLLANSFSLASKHGWNNLVLLPIVFTTLHFSYGLGTFWGLLTVRQWMKNHNKLSPVHGSISHN